MDRPNLSVVSDWPFWIALLFAILGGVFAAAGLAAAADPLLAAQGVGRCGRERRTDVLITMAGLPSSGKSTLAASLKRELGAVVLDKDRVRAALFPARVLDYSDTQDDIAMAAIYQA